VIVSFSTIGFGDIFPVMGLSRISTCIMCVLNITVMSNFLGHFIEHLFALSPYYKDYDFKDHVVVIGDISKDFMEELIENDLVERDMNNPMGQLSTGIKCIIVSE
jgi:Ion channel